MANLGDMVVRIVGDNSNLDSSLTVSQKKLKSFEDATKKMGRSLSLFVTAPIIAAGVAAVKSAGDMEMYQSAFETMLGSAEAAAAMLKEMKEFAAQTPFSFPDIAEASKTLLAFGVDANQVMPIVKNLGDVAQGNGERFKQLSLVYGQISSTGRLMGQDLLQLINAGFNPLQEISQKTGKSMIDLKAAMEKGLISSQMVTDAFISATSEGGKFFNGMENASKTLPGLWSTMSDSIAEAGRSLVASLLPTIKEIVKGITSLTTWFGNLSPQAKNSILAFAGIAAAAGPLLTIISKVGTAIRTMNTATGLMTATVGGAVAAIGALIFAFIKIRQAMAEMKKEQELVDGAMKGTLGSSIEYSEALAVMKRKIDEAKKADEEWSLLEAQNSELWGDASAQRTKALKDLETQQKVMIANSEKQAKTEKTLAAQQAQTAADQAQAAQDAAVKAALAEGARLEKEATIKRVAEEVKKASMTEQELIDAEIAKLKEYGIADADITAYMQSSHAEFYKQEKENIKEVTEERIDAASKAMELDQQVRESVERNLDDIEAKQRDSLEKQKDMYSGWADSILEIMSELFSLINTIRQQDLAAEIAKLDAELQEKLWEAGLAEAVTEEQLRADIEKAKAAGDAEKVLELEKALAKLAITKEYEKKKAKLQYDAAMVAWQLNLTMAIAEAARAVINGLLTQPFIPAGLAAGILAGILGGIQIAAVANARPTPPALAEGGIAPAIVGGRQYTLGEGGQPEAVIPLDQLGRMLPRGNMGSDTDQVPVMLTILLDRDKIYDGIFNATKNRTVLIHNGAVV
jgi:hypothetical protein